MGVFLMLDSCAMMLQDAYIPIKEYKKPNQQNQMKKQIKPTITTAADEMKKLHLRIKLHERFLASAIRKSESGNYPADYKAEYISRKEDYLQELNERFMALLNK